jgi:hypothetical protein
MHSMLYVVWYSSGIGAFGLVYRNGDPFMAFFLALGASFSHPDMS